MACLTLALKNHLTKLDFFLFWVNSGLKQILHMCMKRGCWESFRCQGHYRDNFYT